MITITDKTVTIDKKLFDKDHVWTIVIGMSAPQPIIMVHIAYFLATDEVRISCQHRISRQVFIVEPKYIFETPEEAVKAMHLCTDQAVEKMIKQLNKQAETLD